jgi:hypothetical protein
LLTSEIVLVSVSGVYINLIIVWLCGKLLVLEVGSTR